MAYTLKSPIDFQNYISDYLVKNPLEPSYEENLINNFNSNKLSDLYKLFVSLNNCTLNENLLNKLKNILNNNFSINAEDFFMISIEKFGSPYISADNIKKLELIIKDKFLELVSDSKNPDKDIDKEEFYKLSVIVNKAFPEAFLDLIKNPNGNIEKQQQIIRDKILSTFDHWHNHNSKESEQEVADIAGAFYIVAKKLYPDLNIYIPGRIKSTKSSLANINKETKISLSSLLPNDISVGLTDEDVEKQFNLKGANTDFSGITIVLAGVNSTLHFDKTDPKSKEFLKLKKIRNNHISFTHNLEDFLSENESDFLTNLDLLQIKIELLTRLTESTYPECTREYENTSFNELLKSAIKDFNSELESPKSKQFYDDEMQYLIALDEIYSLLDELKKRIDDKYHSKLLEIAIPDILSDPIFSETLKIKSSFVKNTKKPNGFCSSYYSIETQDGKKIELQAQSKRRFEDSKIGTSDHSTLPDKEISILHFFEPTDSNCTAENFEYFLNILNTTPIAVKNILNNTQDSELSPTDKRLKRKIKLAEQNVKLKDKYEFESVLPDGSIQKSEFLFEKYLPIFAEYVSPKLMTISSPHTRFNKSIAGYDKKNLIAGFTEVLLKHDATSCLAQQLIDELEKLIPSEKNKLSLNGIHKRASERDSR